MEVTGVICSECGQFIYSRTRHDFHWCSCGNVAIDGGQTYVKISGDINAKIETRNLPGVTIEDLIRDWNLAYDQYGWQDD